MSMLLLPVVRFSPALAPMPMLLLPVVFATKRIDADGAVAEPVVLG